MDADALLAQLDAPLRAALADADLAALWKAVRQAWPDIGVGAERFVPFLAERARRVGSAAALNVSDLFLACSCLERDASALRAFDALLEEVGRKLRRVSASPATLDEGKQFVRQFLLPGQERPPLLSDYDGRGELGGWLRLALGRELLRLRKVSACDARLDTAEKLRVVDGQDDPEAAHFKTHYQREFKESFAAAMQQLDAAERRALRYAIVERLAIDDIARLDGVHRATAARLLARARERLAKETRRVLRDRLRVDPDQLQSILRLVDGEVDVSVERLLAV